MIDIKRRVRMSLEKRCGHLDVDLSLDGAPDDARLVLAGRDDRDLARVENRRDAHRHRLARNVLLAEEIRCGVAPRHRVECYKSRSALASRARLVEADVARLPMPRICRSIPPARSIASSYRCAASSISVRGRSPGGM
jgi:hypothetical protein